MNEICLQNMRT